MINFAYRHLTAWKAGQGQPEIELSGNLPNAKIVFVRHDQKTIAYEIEPREMDEFKRWCSVMFEDCNQVIDDNESIDDYLDRIDCHVSIQ